MLSKEFIKGMQYELQNRAFALSAITQISKRVQGTPEYAFWRSYEKLEQFNQSHYDAYANKNRLNSTPSFLTKMKAWTIGSTPRMFLDQLLKLVYRKTVIYMEDLKQVRTQGAIEDRAFLDYMIAQEQIQIELMALAIKKQYRDLEAKIDQFIEIYSTQQLL